MAPILWPPAEESPQAKDQAQHGGLAVADRSFSSPLGGSYPTRRAAARAMLSTALPVSLGQLLCCMWGGVFIGIGIGVFVAMDDLRAGFIAFAAWTIGGAGVAWFGLGYFADARFKGYVPGGE